MKKTKLKNYLKLGIFLFGITFVFMKCERDYIEEVQENSIITESIEEGGIQIRTITLNQLQQKTDLQKTLSKLSKSFDINKSEGSTTSKVDANDGSFTILTDEIMEAITNSTEAYTFRIETPTDSASAFENFVIDKPNDSLTKFYIYKYVYDETSEGDFPYITSFTEVDEDIVDIANFDGLLSRVDYGADCIVSTTCIVPCWAGNCHTADMCDGSGAIFANTVDCTGGSSGGDPDDDGDTSGGGGGTVTTDPTDPTDLDPSPTGVLPKIEYDDNIIELNNLTNNTQIKDRIDQMVGELNISVTEQGSEFRTTGTPNDYSEYQIPASELEFSGTHFPPAIATSKVRVHMHHNTTDANGNGIASVFSAEDIFGMADFYTQKKDLGSADVEDITSILVSIRGLYAFRVSDADRLEAFYNDINNPTYKKNFIKNFKIIVIKNTIDYCSSCTDEQYAALFEAYFVAFFNQFNLGISLYEATIDLSGNYTWSLLN